MMRNALRAVILPAVLVFSLPAVCRADDQSPDTLAPLQVGPVIVNPSLSVKEVWTDNVFAVAENPTGDFVTSIAPGLLLRLPFRTHELSLGARASIETYADNSSEDIAPWQVSGLGTFAIGDRLNLRIGDTFRQNYETALESTTGSAEKNSSNTALVSARYGFLDVAQARLDYSRTSLRFGDVDDYRSRDEDLVSAYLYYRVLPNTSAFLEYDFKKVAYTEDAGEGLDNEVQSGSLGATWEFTENSKGTVKAGFQSKDFKDSAAEDYTTWTASADLSHDLTEIDTLRVLGAREVNEGKYLGTRFYTTTGISVEYTHRFLDRLAGILSGGYGVDEFSDVIPGDDAVRKDTSVRAGVGARYSFNSWLGCSLRYGYLNRDSNIANYSVKENVVAFEITARR